MRLHNRTHDALRKITFTHEYTKHAEGSVLAQFGDTIVLCNASIIDGVPKFLKDSKQGWLTAEYAMLPRATHIRSDRDAVKGKQNGRAVEIQRLIGRALRAAVRLEKLENKTIAIDCDVIQADGGTRTAAISGACVALYDALHKIQRHDAFKQWIAAVSVGICSGVPVLDLDYTEDSTAESDMNIVMTEHGAFIEIQGTAEGSAFHEHELQALLALAKKGIAEIMNQQKI